MLTGVYVFVCDLVGAHVARPKCIGLDSWSEEEAFRLEALGNQAAASFWESGMSNDVTRPTPESSNREVTRWIKAKYERFEYMHPTMPKPTRLPPVTPMPTQ